MLEGSILQKLETAHQGGNRPLNFGVYYKNTLVALCHALEDFILESNSAPLMITAFQRGKRLCEVVNLALLIATVGSGSGAQLAAAIAVEVLEGVPTVAFGFFAFSFITPLLQEVWPGFLGDGPNIFNAGAAGLAIGLLIVPIIASISHDAMSAVPQGLRSGAYALGAAACA